MGDKLSVFECLREGGSCPASGRLMSVPAAAIETPREAEVELAAEPSTRFQIVIPQGGQMLDIGETSYAA
jgi:hypothetical protein